VVGPAFETIAIEWIKYLTNMFGIGPDDPLFPAPKIGMNADGGLPVHPKCSGSDLI